MANQTESKLTTRVFISYSRKDSEFVRILHSSLEKRGMETWVDWEGIPLTADWWAEIKAGIESTDAFIFVISPDSLTSKVCGDEIQAAIDNHKRIVPILHREPEKGNPIHPKISSHNWVFIRDEAELNNNIEDMVQIINTDLDWVKDHTRLLVRANEWHNQSLNSSFLLRGDDLHNAELWLKQAEFGKEPDPTELQIDYIHTSRRDTTRRRRLTIGGIAVGLIIALLAVIAAYSATVAIDEAEKARIAEAEAEMEAENARRAEAEAERQEQLAAASLELAALSNAGKIIQPLLWEYSVQNAIDRASNELNNYDYKINVAPERVVAEELLNIALFAEFMSGGVPEEQTTSMFQLFRRSLGDDPTMDDGIEFNSALLYTKFCQQIPELTNHKAVLPACEQAIAMADQLENAWLSFQVCNLGQIDKLNVYSEQISKICTEFDNMINAVALEEPVQGTIRPGSNDVWLFQGEADQTIYIYMREDSSDLDSYIDLYDVNGDIVATDDQGGGGNDALIVYTPEQESALYIVAHGYDLETNGAYELVVSSTQPEAITAVFASFAEDQGEISFGEVVEATIQAGQKHGWTFAGEAGQTVNIFMGALDGQLDSYLILNGPDGEFLAEDDDGGGNYDSLISITLPDTGIYQIEAAPYDPEFGEGEYYLELYANATEVDFFSGESLGDLEMNTAVFGTIDAGVNNQWTFTGNAGDFISVAMVADEGNLDPFLQLIAPDGSIIAEDDDGFGNLNALIMTELPLSGNYRVVAQAFDINSFGNYQLELSDETASFSFGEPTFEDLYYGDAFADAPLTIFASPNSSAEQLVNVPQDAYLFVKGRSENGDWYHVEYTGVIYEGYVAAERVFFDGDAAALPVFSGDIEPFDDGNEFIEDEAGEDEEPGAASGGDIFSGVPVMGNLIAGGEDEWTFAGEAGDQVTISMVSPGGELDTYLLLLDPSGNIIMEDDDGFGDTNSLINAFELPESGLYTIIAAGFDDTTAGAYELTLLIE